MPKVTLSTEQKLDVKTKQVEYTNAELALKEASHNFEKKKNELLFTVQTVATNLGVNFEKSSFSLDTLEFTTPDPEPEAPAPTTTN